jgi:hypothetical protein
MNDRAKRRQCEVLRLRNLAMIESIRHAQDPAWSDRLEQQQLAARLGRMFGRNRSPLEAMLDHAHALNGELRATPLPWADMPGGAGMAAEAAVAGIARAKACRCCRIDRTCQQI